MICARCPREAHGSLVLCCDCVTALLRRDRRDSEPAVPMNAGAVRNPGSAPDSAHPWPADDNEAAPPPDATGAARPPASAGPAPSRQTGQLALSLG